MKKQVVIGLDEDVFEKIEKLRGIAPRATYLNSILRREVDNHDFS